MVGCLQVSVAYRVWGRLCRVLGGIAGSLVYAESWMGCNRISVGSCGVSGRLCSSEQQRDLFFGSVIRACRSRAEQMNTEMAKGWEFVMEVGTFLGCGGWGRPYNRM